MNATPARSGTWVLSGTWVRGAIAAALTASLALAGSVSATGPDLARVIVREVDAASTVVEDAVAGLGGAVGQQLPIIGGFAAEVPEHAVAQLAADPAVLAVTPNAAVELNQLVDEVVATTDTVTSGATDTVTTTDTGALITTEGVAEDTSTAEVATDLLVAPVLESGKATIGVDPSLKGAPRNVAAAIGSDWALRKGVIGKRVDVAVIDSGMVPVDGLEGRIVDGIDLSFEAGAEELRGLDTFGHGTHISAIIAGRAHKASKKGKKDPDAFRGIAPGARVVNVKVASANGATDVSQVIAALDWVVQNRRTDGRNIRVVNLAFGTDGAQPAAIDPLVHATDMAVRSGLVVVVSAGNLGDSLGRLTNPAVNPNVIAVGAVDTKGTVDRSDDEIPAWSQVGNRERHPDVVAPGVSLVSLRTPGSYIDTVFPDGREGSALFRGSGTSQAAAVVSGVAALMLSYRPKLTPDQVKSVMMASATPVPGASVLQQGAGMIDVRAMAKLARKPARHDSEFRATGRGSIEAARGTMHIRVDTDGDGVEDTLLEGDQTFTGSTWSGPLWSGSLWSGSTWSGSTWSGSTWSGSTWSGSTWSAAAWE